MVMGQARPSCKEVIAAADKALEAKDKALSLADLTIKECKTYNEELHVKNTELIDDSGKWYRNPVIVFILGAASGTLTYTLLKK
jgi:hypothetical protein